LKLQRWVPGVIFSRGVSYIAIVIPVLLNVAFFTLLERKILGLRQARKGPNKVAFGGLLQPFADAIKLFLKERAGLYFSNYFLFLFSPVLAIFLILWLWAVIPLSRGALPVLYSALIFLVILSLNLYPLLIAGWASNSKYALVGAIRGVAQTISYEIRLALLLLRFLSAAGSARIGRWLWEARRSSLLLLALPLLVLWVISCVAETNRTPFDFAEGESELVSGFNIEYGAVGFALIFIAEYARILFLRLLRAALALGMSSLRRGGGFRDSSPSLRLSLVAGHISTLSLR
jgi:NADH-ubiquinone oxidoreductase chain 1